MRRERSAAKTTGANNRYITIFAPGKSRRIFSKKCKPASAHPKAERFIQEPYSATESQAVQNESKIHFERGAAQAAPQPIGMKRSFISIGY
ncbi:MAG: hypothetical protein IKR85_03585 [Clostridia bacterium]|nr:hypothetical protein [Clostridia bacterium]